MEYRRHFVAIVLIRNNVMKWWAYPKARGWCTRRVSGAERRERAPGRVRGLWREALGSKLAVCWAGNRARLPERVTCGIGHNVQSASGGVKLRLFGAVSLPLPDRLTA